MHRCSDLPPMCGRLWRSVCRSGHSCPIPIMAGIHACQAWADQPQRGLEPMELRLARYFLEVAAHRSVTGAAAQARIAQPSLSRRLRALETELGCRLFDRGPHGVKLTRGGERFLPMARDLVSRADAAAAAMESFAAGQAMPFSVVAPATTVADVVAPFLARSGPDAPSITVREELPSSVFDTLAAGGADVAISSGPPPGGMEVRPLVRFAVWAYVPRDHRWA